jgi:hypothetical protein
MRYRRHLRRPSLWNTLKFKVSLLPLFNPLSRFPMSISRRNIIIRTVAALCGDIAVGVAVGTACAWLIASASLGLFLAFLLWLLGTLLALALSQYLVHPAMNALLSDRKLDDAARAATALRSCLGRHAGSVLAGMRSWRSPA